MNYLISDAAFHELLGFVQNNAVGLWWLNALWACTFAVYASRGRS